AVVFDERLGGVARGQRPRLLVPGRIYYPVRLLQRDRQFVDRHFGIDDFDEAVDSPEILQDVVAGQSQQASHFEGGGVRVVERSVWRSVLELLGRAANGEPEAARRGRERTQRAAIIHQAGLRVRQRS